MEVKSSMSKTYEIAKESLRQQPKTWLITGVAGFIGSNLLEALLKLDQQVIGLDNFATGYRHNLEDVRAAVSEKQWSRFYFIEGDIADMTACRKAMQGVDYVLHHAAFVSVPASLKDPLAAHRSNVTGFLNVLIAARDAKVGRVVYAASSASYGDDPAPLKTEAQIGRQLSPYATTKYINELYADIFGSSYGTQSIGLRYFNIFGRRQDPNGAYAAVIPKWIDCLLAGERCVINGDGETTRDFCHVENVIQANILAASTTNDEAINQVYNIGNGGRTTLNDLYELIYSSLAKHKPSLADVKVSYGPFRPGDVRDSQADISKAQTLLGYFPGYSVGDGLEQTLAWYLRHSETSGEKV